MAAVLTAEEMLAIAQEACAAPTERTESARLKRKRNYRAHKAKIRNRQADYLKAEKAKCHFFNSRGFAKTCDYVLHPARAGCLSRTSGPSQPEEKRKKRSKGGK